MLRVLRVVESRGVCIAAGLVACGGERKRAKIMYNERGASPRAHAVGRARLPVAVKSLDNGKRGARCVVRSSFKRGGQ